MGITIPRPPPMGGEVINSFRLKAEHIMNNANYAILLF